MIVKVATLFLDVDRNTITLSVVTARINDTTKAAKKELLIRGASICQKIFILPAPRLEAASPKDGEILLKIPDLWLLCKATA